MGALTKALNFGAAGKGRVFFIAWGRAFELNYQLGLSVLQGSEMTGQKGWCQGGAQSLCSGSYPSTRWPWTPTASSQSILINGLSVLDAGETKVWISLQGWLQPLLPGTQGPRRADGAPHVLSGLLSALCWQMFNHNLGWGSPICSTCQFPRCEYSQPWWVSSYQPDSLCVEQGDTEAHTVQSIYTAQREQR